MKRFRSAFHIETGRYFDLQLIILFAMKLESKIVEELGAWTTVVVFVFLAAKLVAFLF